MFRFRIRELVLLTLIVAMGVAWWIDRSRLTTEVDEMRGRLIQETTFGRAARRDARETIAKLQNAMKAAGVPIPDEPSVTIGDVLDAMERAEAKPK